VRQRESERERERDRERENLCGCGCVCVCVSVSMRTSGGGGTCVPRPAPSSNPLILSAACDRLRALRVSRVQSLGFGVQDIWGLGPRHSCTPNVLPVFRV